MTPLVAILAALAVYRCTLLLTADTITEPLRSRFIGWVYRRTDGGAPKRPKHRDGKEATWDEFARQDPEPPKLVTLSVCPWCASAYCAAPIAWSAWCFGDRAWWFVPALALAASAVSGFLAEYASPAK